MGVCSSPVHCAITWGAWSESQSLKTSLSISRKVPHVVFLMCLTFDPRNLMMLQHGGVTEWPNVPVLKTGDLVRGPRVQISPPPPHFNRLCGSFRSLLALKQFRCHRKCHLFPLNILSEPRCCLLQVFLTGDVVPVENRARQVPADLHGYRFRHPCPH